MKKKIKLKKIKWIKIKKALINNKEKLQGNIKNLNILIATVWIVMVWRWLWNLLDLYFFPEQSLILLSNIWSIFIWLIILLIYNNNLENLKN